jgi:hypothetical protein
LRPLPASLTSGRLLLVPALFGAVLSFPNPLNTWAPQISRGNQPGPKPDWESWPCIAARPQRATPGCRTGRSRPRAAASPESSSAAGEGVGGAGGLVRGRPGSSEHAGRRDSCPWPRAPGGAHETQTRVYARGRWVGVAGKLE